MKRMYQVKRMLAVLLAVALVLSSAKPLCKVKAADEAVNVQQSVFTGDNYSVEFILDSCTQSKYHVRVVIKNTGDTAIEDWKLNFVFSEEIENIYNASIVSQDNESYIVKCLDWNQDIPVNGEVSFGFSGTAKGEFDYPISVCVPSNVLRTELNKAFYDISFEAESTDERGYIVTGLITNKSQETIEDWVLEFDFADKIQTVWGAYLLSQDNDKVIIKNADYRQNIKVDETVKFQFLVCNGNGYKEPSNIRLTSFEEKIVLPQPEVTPTVEPSSEPSPQPIYTPLDMQTMEPSEEPSEEPIVEPSEEPIVEPSEEPIVEPSEEPVVEPSEEPTVEPSVVPSPEPSEGAKATIDNIFITDKTIVAGESVKDRVTLTLNGMNQKSQYSVKVFECLDNEWSLLKQLEDGGNLAENGDEIKNDGVFSNFISLSRPEQGTIDLKFVVYENDEQIAEEMDSVTVVSDVTDEELKECEELRETLSDYLEKYAVSLGEDETVSLFDVIEYIYMNCNDDDIINDIEEISDYTAKVILNSGLSFFIELTDDSDMEVMKRGSGNAEMVNDQVIEQETSYDYVLSKKVLLWAPFDTEWGKNDEVEAVKNIVGESLGSSSLTVVSDANANIASLSNLDDYGLIIFSSHGLNGEWIVTGEEVKDNSKYREEISAGQVSTYLNVSLKGGIAKTYYMVHSSWFENQAFHFPNSIIMNNSCESTKTDKLWNAFENCGAKTYVGYTGAVTNDYITVETTEFVSRLLFNSKSVQESFEFSYDTYYTAGDFMNILGAGNIKLASGAMNIDFEDDLSGWNTDGDGRVITKLGSITPTSGDKMAIISTGLGYTLELGEISQNALIPKGATSMTFDWNFISEEFIEYIGSQFDDPFCVELAIVGDDNSSEIVLDLNVNNIAAMFDATRESGGNLIPVSPEIVFDQGDVWMTGWQNQSVDVSKFAGQNVTLKFSVKDATDTIYTTAVLIDNIQFDAVYESAGSAKPISDELSFSALKEKCIKKSKGISYIFYLPDGAGEEGFSEQAKILKKAIKYKYGYSANSQVVTKPVSTENAFVSFWKSMDGTIDSVSLLFPASYYSVLFGSLENKQSLTVSPDKRTEKDESSIDIRSLNKNKINTINIYGCNTGLLDAIDVSFDKGEEDTFSIKGNVAQAFLETQNVSKVIAWDGDISFSAYSAVPRMADNQDSFEKWVGELESVKVYSPQRRTAAFQDTEQLEEKNSSGDLPNGETVYYMENGNMYVKYQCQKDKLMTVIHQIGNYQ